MTMPRQPVGVNLQSPALGARVASPLCWKYPVPWRSRMAEYDLVVRNTTIATAVDVVRGDIGIVNGRVVALGSRLAKATKEIDATGLVAVPGGIDAHVHFDQDTADGSEFCDGFESGSRAAAAGCTTTIIPFAYPR